MRSSISALVLILSASCVFETEAFRRKLRPDNLPSAVKGQRELVELSDGVQYFFGLNQGLTFSDSQEQCENMNMTLANLDTQEKYDMFLDFLLENPSYDYWMWVSGRRAADTSTWLWSSSGETFSFTSWSPGQPDLEETLDACADFAGYYGNWEDDECEVWQMSYLCEPKPESY